MLPYKLDTFSSGIEIGYELSNNLFTILILNTLKDYKITNSSTVSIQF